MSITPCFAYGEMLFTGRQATANLYKASMRKTTV